MESRERVLNAEEAAKRFQPILEAGGRVTLAVTGSSMLPYLRQGRDRVCLTAPDRALRRGDILFFRRPTGEWVLHRLMRHTADGYVVSGDAQFWIEFVKPEQIAAVVMAVERKGKSVGADSVRFRAWAAFWMALRPARALYVRARRALGGSADN